MSAADSAGYVPEPQRFRKRPVEVEALRYDGPAWLPRKPNGSTPRNEPEWEPLIKFMGGWLTSVQVGTVTHGGPDQFAPAITTKEGVMRISPGDFVIKGVVAGEFYPCKPDIFEATYEPVRDENSTRTEGDCG